MPWFAKTGALYMRENGNVTYLKAFAKSSPSKGGKLPPGWFWSEESAPSRRTARTAAGQREAELETKYARAEFLRDTMREASAAPGASREG